MEFTLTRSQARQFYVLWQGLSGPYRWRTNTEIVTLIAQLGCLQFDPIDICGRNADLVLRRGSVVIGKVSWKPYCIRIGS